MANTDSGFQFYDNLRGGTTGIIQTFLIEDSGTITVGDMVRGSYDSAGANGMIEVADAGNPILGVVVGIVDKDGIDMDNSKQSITGTWTSSTKTYVAETTNETVDKVQAQVDIDPMSRWTAQPDGAIGTTTSSGSSDQLGSFTDLIADSDQPDETNNSNAFNAVAQLFIWGVDPANTAHGIYSIAEHQIWGG